jgi:SAM-dependent methyltransferase
MAGAAGQGYDIGMNQSVEQHYARSDLAERIFAALRADGKDLQNLTVDDLAPVDQFHTRGRQSSVELLELAGVTETDRVLDIGCGLGGSARLLARQAQCHVTGLDLTEDFIRVARQLTACVDLADRCDFVVGDATGLPFADTSFDVVWSEHAQMNIADKALFLREIARVLKPAGRFAFHDVFAGSGEPQYPLPWAEDPSISFLCTASDFRQMAIDAGLPISVWKNTDRESRQAFERAARNSQGQNLPALGTHLLMGSNTRQKIHNYLVNLENGSMTVAMGMACRSAATTA